MQRSAGKLVFSPSDLIKFMESEYITWMDRFDLERPGIAERDPESETDKILQARGIAHEAEHLAQLRAAGREIIDISDSEDRFTATIAAMQAGADIIYQGALRDEVTGDDKGTSDEPGEARPCRPRRQARAFVSHLETDLHLLLPANAQSVRRAASEFRRGRAPGFHRYGRDSCRARI